MQLAVFAHDEQDPTRARQLEDDSLTLAIESGDHVREAKVRGLIASLAVESGDLERAKEHALAALGRYETLHIPRSIGFTTGQLGHIAELSEDWQTARAYYKRAIQFAIDVDDQRLHGTWLGHLGRVDVHTLAGDIARERLTQAIAILTQINAPRLIPDFHRALAVNAAFHGDVDRATHHASLCSHHKECPVGEFAVLTARIGAARQIGADTGPLIAMANRRFEVLSEESSTSRDPLLDLLYQRAQEFCQAMLVDRQGQWFQLPPEEKVLIKGANARVLACLIAHHGASPCDVDTLFKAGWPDEKAKPSTAQNRVYVALATLRKAGLREHIQKEARGWKIPSSTLLQFQ